MACIRDGCFKADYSLHPSSIAVSLVWCALRTYGVQAVCIGPMDWLRRVLLVEGTREVQEQHVNFWRLETLIGRMHTVVLTVVDCYGLLPCNSSQLLECMVQSADKWHSVKETHSIAVIGKHGRGGL
eukprot:1153787-Pelagomonas_calceolata.AAC.4